jgi:DMSO/TMAO reductase YedYZ molybdopterin-dependent catalytic subunit
MIRYTRRKFLGLTATATLAGLASACASPTASPDPAPIAPSETAALPASQLPNTSASAPLGVSGVGTSQPPLPAPEQTLITPTDKFYIQSFSSTSTVDPDTWSLAIDGLVERPLTLTLADIKARPAAEVMRTLECIGNPVGGPQIGNALWKGTYLKPLLDEAGIKPSAYRLKFSAADHYDTAIDLKFIYDDRSFLAYEMNGEPLTPQHGFPLRVFFPGSYGQKMPKWVTRLELIDYEHEGYWEERGWSDVAQVKTNSIIDEPYANAKFALQTIPIWGVAYAGKRDILKVEVKVGDAEWRAATLLPGPTNEVWTQWSFDWQPIAEGNYKLQVRATDSDGFTQSRTSGLLDGYPDGSDAVHSIYVKILEG